MPIDPPPFIAFNLSAPVQPVLISVPHAGRYYPPALLAQARVPLAALERLEDRYCDRLCADAVATGFAVHVATYARAWIDLNRDEGAWDEALVAGAAAPRPPDRLTRAGLGLIPRALHPDGALWRTRIAIDDLRARIETVHRPWHQAIAERSAALATRFGHAVVIDLHSMPSQPRGEPTIVFGDRFGRTASADLIDRLTAIAEGAGFRVGRNIPYAGAHGIERHGRRSGPVEAVQVEIDRALYLSPDGAIDEADSARIVRLVLALAQGAARHCATRRTMPLAAE